LIERRERERERKRERERETERGGGCAGVPAARAVFCYEIASIDDLVSRRGREAA
tara:strand:+ start:503 stop:667 length:165 start_codon:yes stop_codon:yes gene_type:complete